VLVLFWGPAEEPVKTLVKLPPAGEPRSLSAKSDERIMAGEEAIVEAGAIHVPG
jgi:hypothetical protein